MKNGDVIPLDRTTVPPDINALLDATNRGLQAIPQDNLKTVVDEAYIAVGGLGPGAVAAGQRYDRAGHRRPQEPRLADHADRPVQAGAGLARPTPSDSVQAWAAHLATHHRSAAEPGPGGRGHPREGRPAPPTRSGQLFDRLQPTLPIVLANLVSVGEVAVTYQPSLEQLLVLLPQGTAVTQAVGVHNRNTKQDYNGLTT